MTESTVYKNDVARIIANTNEKYDRWASAGRAEKERRLAEADAVLKFLENNTMFNKGRI